MADGTAGSSGPVDFAHLAAGLALHPLWCERHTVVAAPPDRPELVAFTAARYPNLGLAEASVTAVRHGVQHAVHTSARLGPGTAASGETLLAVGPVVLRGAETLALETAAGAVTAGGALHLHDAPGPVGDVTVEVVDPTGPGGVGRATSSGWSGGALEGRVELAGAVVAVAGWPAVHELRRGVEAVDGVTITGAPALTLPQWFRWQAVVVGDDGLAVAAADEDADGRPRWAVGARGAAGGAEPTVVTLRPAWHRGTRHLAAAGLAAGDRPVEELEVEATLLLRGLGVASPTFPRGAWHDEVAVGIESFVVEAPDDAPTGHRVEPVPIDRVPALHLARRRDQPGMALIETSVVGPHRPSGLTGFTDGAG